MKHISHILQWFSSIFLCGILVGCPGPLNNPAAWANSFARNGATVSEVRVALLECGANVPGDEMEYRTPDGKIFPPAFKEYESVLIGKCMKNSGFSYNDDRVCAGGVDISGKLVIPPACKSDGEKLIPTRSIENRLNSLYCKSYPKTDICQPGYDPSKAALNTLISSEPDHKATSKTIYVIPSIDPSIKLQNQVQKDSNTQMNQLLQGTEKKK